MARSDANGKEPTIEEINDKAATAFQGFSTTDGVPSKGAPTAEEAAAAAAASARAQRQDPAADEEEAEELEEGDNVVTETPEDKAARETREAAQTDKQKVAQAKQAKLAGGKGSEKHRSANERIGQAVAKQRETERALSAEREARAKDRGEFEARLAALEKRPLTADGKPVTVVDKDAPRPQDYEYGELDAKYIRDLAVHETRKELAADRISQTAAQQTAEQRREAQEFQAKAAKFETAGLEKFDDFSEVVVEGAKSGDWPLTKTFGDLMFDSEHGPDIAYYLATHTKEAKEIMAKSTTAQAVAFGRLETAFSSLSLDAAEQQEEPAAERAVSPAAQARTTQAPPPPQRRARGAGGKTQVSAETNDFAAFERMAMGRE